MSAAPMPPMPHDQQHIPRGALFAAGLLIVVAILGVAAVRLTGATIHEPDAQAVAVKRLRFEDRADGSIAIIDVDANGAAQSLQGEQGFVRGTLRALARERRMRGVGPEQPFELIGRADGRLTLFDPATGQRIDLESFGPTNAGVFSRLLQAR